MIFRSPFLFSLTLGLALLTSCGGGSDDAKPAVWTEPLQIATLPVSTQVGDVKLDPGGGLNFSASGDIPATNPDEFSRTDFTFYRRAPQTGAWSAVFTLPEPFGCCVRGWTVDERGPSSVLVDTFTQSGFHQVRRAADGSWLAPSSVPIPAHDARFVELPMAEFVGGAAVQPFAYFRSADQMRVLAAMRYAPASGWQADELAVAPSSASLQAAGAAVGSRGEMIVTWTETWPPGNISYRIYSPGSGWGATQTVPAANAERYTHVAAAGQGSFLLTHVSCTGGGQCTPMVSRYDPGTGWGAPISLRAPTAAPPFLEARRVHVGPGGHAIAFWGEGRIVNAGTFNETIAYQPWSSYYTPGVGWGAPVIAPSAGERAAIDNAGRVTAFDGRSAMRFDPASGWKSLAPPMFQAGMPTQGFAMDAAGVISAVWTELSGSRFFFSRYE